MILAVSSALFLWRSRRGLLFDDVEDAPVIAHDLADRFDEGLKRVNGLLKVDLADISHSGSLCRFWRRLRADERLIAGFRFLHGVFRKFVDLRALNRPLIGRAD